MSTIVSLIESLQDGNELSQQQMRQAIAELLDGKTPADTMRELLMQIARRGETADELAGAAQGLRDSMHRIEARKFPVVDTCGTGGDGAKTFNISTAAAIAIAACDVRVAKHGNRKITSSTGSADVLGELGINLDASIEQVQHCLDEVGICFCFAPLFHPAMKHVGPVRKSIPHPTIFNRLGPLGNPASADCQVLGVGDASLHQTMARALQLLGTTHSIVVRGEDGVDEISLTADTHVLEVTKDSLRPLRWSPRDFGVQPASRDSLFADDPVSSAACIREVFSGQSGPRRDCVVINAAAGLWVAGIDSDLKQCAGRVEAAIDSGRGQQILEQLSIATRSNLK